MHDLKLFQFVEQGGLAGMRVKNSCLCEFFSNSDDSSTFMPLANAYCEGKIRVVKAPNWI